MKKYLSIFVLSISLSQFGCGESVPADKGLEGQNQNDLSGKSLPPSADSAKMVFDGTAASLTDVQITAFGKLGSLTSNTNLQGKTLSLLIEQDKQQILSKDFTISQNAEGEYSFNLSATNQAAETLSISNLDSCKLLTYHLYYEGVEIAGGSFYASVDPAAFTCPIK